MKALRKGVQKDVKFTRPAILPVQVQCGTQRCLAYRDKSGVWIDYEDGAPLEGSIRVISKLMR